PPASSPTPTMLQVGVKRSAGGASPYNAEVAVGVAEPGTEAMADARTEDMGGSADPASRPGPDAAPDQSPRPTAPARTRKAPTRARATGYRRAGTGSTGRWKLTPGCRAYLARPGKRRGTAASRHSTR